ncbi:expressed unknown protein [Seminavis robusta]|uniref:Uncharacterized protein n=1 Tax=Seminavis robusta TaxID=568900 RepID=A0A9N8DV63_9STRA|nr:expressed unknown protein [Seminavis robusta]|eukprot:Sro306_g113080.1 n/a (668) ;mRNA; r:55905-57908
MSISTPTTSATSNANNGSTVVSTKHAVVLPAHAKYSKTITKFLKSGRFRWVAVVGCILLQVQYAIQNRYAMVFENRNLNTTMRRLDQTNSNNLPHVDLEFLGAAKNETAIINNDEQKNSSEENQSTTALEEEEETASDEPKEPPKQPETVNVLFGLHGSNQFFFDEWEVAFKSVLLNAPLDAPLHIHIVANGDAHVRVQERLQDNHLIGSLWRNPITVTIYNVERRQAEFHALLKHAFRGGQATIDERVSLGGYYRLLSPMVLPQGTGPVAYMDADAVIMANLGDLWKHVNASYSFQASATWLCSAFIIINIDRAGNFWDLVDQLPIVDHGGDQSLLEKVTKANPEIMGPLPVTWDTHMGHGHRPVPHHVLKKRPDGVGFLHFNGNRPNYFHDGLQQYCDRAKSCKDDPRAQQLFQQTWGLADYYVNMPWEWAKYTGGVSKIPPGETGHPLRYVEIMSNSTWIPPTDPPTKPRQDDHATTSNQRKQDQRTNLRRNHQRTETETEKKPQPPAVLPADHKKAGRNHSGKFRAVARRSEKQTAAADQPEKARQKATNVARRRRRRRGEENTTQTSTTDPTKPRQTATNRRSEKKTRTAMATDPPSDPRQKATDGAGRLEKKAKTKTSVDEHKKAGNKNAKAKQEPIAENDPRVVGGRKWIQKEGKNATSM